MKESLQKKSSWTAKTPLARTSPSTPAVLLSSGCQMCSLTRLKLWESPPITLSQLHWGFTMTVLLDTLQGNRLLFTVFSYSIFRINYDVACNMDFHRFPVDEQYCEVKFESFGFTNKQVKYHSYQVPHIFLIRSSWSGWISLIPMWMLTSPCHSSHSMFFSWTHTALIIMISSTQGSLWRWANDKISCTQSWL